MVQEEMEGDGGGFVQLDRPLGGSLGERGTEGNGVVGTVGVQ